MRIGEDVTVVLTSHPDGAARTGHLAVLRVLPFARAEVLPALARERIAPELTLRLAPTGRWLVHAARRRPLRSRA